MAYGHFNRRDTDIFVACRKDIGYLQRVPTDRQGQRMTYGQNLRCVADKIR